MKNVEAYHISFGLPDSAERDINARLKDGWEIWGFPQHFVSDAGVRQWAQAMIRREREGPKPSVALGSTGRRTYLKPAEQAER